MQDVLEACDVGHRVVVRHRLTGSPALTDVLGELTHLGADHLVVRAEDGTDHRIRIADVAAAKRVPPRPPRYSEILHLERVADRAWPAPDVAPLGEWLLRAAEGWTNRANSALPLGDSGQPIEAAVEACRRWYGERGLPPRITVPLPVRRDVATTLTSLGWVAQPVVLVQTAPLAGLHAPPAVPVSLLDRPSEDFLALITARKAGLPPAAHRVLTGPAEVRFAEIRDCGLRAITRGAVVDGWLHLGLVEVVPAARRQGLARAAAAALAAWAATRGATRAVLQVEEHNTGAVALYAGQGFTTHHTYITYHEPT